MSVYPIIERARQAPNKCLVSADIDGPFVDLGCWVPDTPIGSTPYAYLHVSVAEKVGRSVGMVSGDEVAALKRQLAEYGERVEKAEAIAQALTTLSEAEETVKELVA